MSDDESRPDRGAARNRSRSRHDQLLAEPTCSWGWCCTAGGRRPAAVPGPGGHERAGGGGPRRPDPAPAAQRGRAATSALVLELLAKEPAQRPGSVRVVVERLAAGTGPGRRPRPVIAARAAGQGGLAVGRGGSRAVGPGGGRPDRRGAGASGPARRRPRQEPCGAGPQGAHPSSRGGERRSASLEGVAVAKTRDQIRPVAQDGRGMYRTGAPPSTPSSRARWSKSWTWGPYREDLTKTLPEDVGLIGKGGRAWNCRPVQGRHGGRGPVSLPRAVPVGASGPAPGGPRERRPKAGGGLRKRPISWLLPPAGGEVVFKSCRIVHQPSYAAEGGGSEKLSLSNFQALVCSGPPGKHEGKYHLRDNHLEGTVTFAAVPQALTIERNHFLGWRYHALAWNWRWASRSSGRQSSATTSSGPRTPPCWWWCGKARKGPAGSGLRRGHRQQPHRMRRVAPGGRPVASVSEAPPLPARLRFQNNIACSTRQRGILVFPEGRTSRNEAAVIATGSSPSSPTFSASRPILPSVPFLSVDPKAPRGSNASPRPAPWPRAASAATCRL